MPYGGSNGILQDQLYSQKKPWYATTTLLLLFALFWPNVAKPRSPELDPYPRGGGAGEALNGVPADNGHISGVAQQAMLQYQNELRQWEEQLYGDQHMEEMRIQEAEIAFLEWVEEFREIGEAPNITPMVEGYMNENNLTIEDVKRVYVVQSGTTHRKRSAAITIAGIWNKCIIPYTFSDTLPEENKIAAQNAMKVYEKETGFRFYPKANLTNAGIELGHNNYLNFMQNSGCNAPLGNKMTEGQDISACASVSTAIHELGHSFGMGHEHAATGNWLFLDTHYKESSYVFTHTRWNIAQMYQNSKSYDPASTMHYGSWAMRKDYIGTFFAMDSDFEYLLHNRENNYYLFKAVQEYNKCYDEFPTCTPLPVCEWEGYPSVIDGICQCKCPEGLDPATGCASIKNKPPAWPKGKYSFLKTNVDPCPEGFATGTMYNNPAYYAWDSSEYHFDKFNSDEYDHNVCTKTEEGTGDPWPAGQYCILRYGGTCPEGFQYGLAETYGEVPTRQDVGTVPDGKHGQLFEYIFCCRNDGDVKEPVNLPIKSAFILYLGKAGECQEIEGMYFKEEKYYMRSDYDAYQVERVGSLPYLTIYSNYTQFIYYCAYFPSASPLSVWPKGKYSFLKTNVEPCPEGFASGTMYNNPAYPTWDSSKYHFDKFNSEEYDHNVCTKTEEGTGDPWPAGQYCILRYGGTCPEGFQYGLAETYGDVSTRQDVGTVPDGKHGQLFQYIFCCRNDGEPTDPMKLPFKTAFILYVGNTHQCQEVEGMYHREEKYYMRSDYDAYKIQRVGSLPYLYLYSNFTQYIYYCAYFPKSRVDCSVTKTLAENEKSFTFSTPNFPNNYQDRSMCTWYIRSPEGSKMQLDFTKFEVSSASDTDCDSYVRVKAFRPGSPGFKFCGHNYQKTLWTYTNYLIVDFTSDMSPTQTGFNATVRVFGAEDKCYKGDGRDRSFAGKVSYDKDFNNCLPWSQVTSCPFHQFDSRFADYDLAENKYCRNIGIAGQPWCYTNAERCSRQICDACMTGSCFDLFDDCQTLIATDSSYCSTDKYGEASRGCKKSCGECTKHVEIPAGATCGAPPVVKGVTPTPTAESYKVGDVVTYKCPTGTDWRESVCTSEGKWTTLNFICGACPSGWAAWKGKCYKYMDWDTNVDFATAISLCDALNASLMQVDSKEKHTYFTSIVDYYPEPMGLAWVGIVKKDNGEWVWLDGSPLSWTWWDRGQPDNNDKEKCVRTGDDGDWNDVPCTDKANVVCEYTPTGPFTCEDQISNCEAVIRSKPDVCTTYPDYAWANCRKSCAVGDCSSTVYCYDDTYLGYTGTRTEGADFITLGQILKYECAEGYYHVSGDLTRGCLPSGSLTGSAPVCSNGDGSEIELFDNQPYKAFSPRTYAFSGPYTYLTAKGGMTFPQAGKVTSWTFYSHLKGGEVAFQIYRPSPDPSKHMTLTFIGENRLTSLPDLRIHTVQIPEAEQVSVQKGDVYGIYVKDKEISFDNCKDLDLHKNDFDGWMYSSGVSDVGKEYTFKTGGDSCRIIGVKATFKLGA